MAEPRMDLEQLERMVESDPKLKAQLARLEEEFADLGRRVGEINQLERWAPVIQDLFFKRQGRTGRFIDDEVLAIVARRLVRLRGLAYSNVYDHSFQHNTDRLEL